jgi:hypothetical protein
MPGSGDQPTSHGSSVSFSGENIGYLTGWRVAPATAQFEESTHIGSTVWGTGAAARVLREYTCSAVEPGGADVTLFGCPPFLVTDTGSQGTLAILFDGGSFSIDAFLESYEVTASVGEMLVGTARFRFSGQDGS